MAKTIKCEFYRSTAASWTSLTMLGGGENIWDDWKTLKKVAPTLCKGLRPGQSREIILTQTKRGIRLEVKK